MGSKENKKQKHEEKDKSVVQKPSRENRR